MSLRYGVVLSVAILSALAIYFVRTRPPGVAPAPVPSISPDVAVVAAKENRGEARRPSVEEVDRAIAVVSRARGVVLFADQIADGKVDPYNPIESPRDMFALSRAYAPTPEEKLTRVALYVGFDTSYDLPKQYPTDAAIAAISGLDMLEGLSVTNDRSYNSNRGPGEYYDEFPVTDAAVTSIAKLSRLRYLALTRTQITARGFLELLPQLTKLEVVHLQDTHLDDATIIAFAEQPGVAPQVLNLVGTNVTDACIPALCRLKSLTAVRTAYTRITPEGERRLEEVILPNITLEQTRPAAR